MKLPEPALDGACSLQKALSTRRSMRAFSTAPLSLQEVSQLMWAAQGVTGKSGERSAPSAGATYPLKAWLAVGKVEGLAPGLYQYEGATHELKLFDAGDPRLKLTQASRNQDFILEAPVSLVFSAQPGSTTGRYPELGDRYVAMEAGHASQNVYLMAAALGLGTVAVGAFDAAAAGRMLWLLPHEQVLYIMPVGKPVQAEKDEYIKGDTLT
jgi:SagB-type dehydrogenase family enzyme